MLEESRAGATDCVAVDGAEPPAAAAVLESGPEVLAVRLGARLEGMEGRAPFHAPCWRRRSGQEAVVGSIILLIGVILLAGKPESSACLRINFSSLAR